ncbi:MAG: class I SAM-dependent methyltransferase [Micrococcales bacterium]|nr:class I SAM-dependent methyltransferase [Micrococcales bacterium]
MAEAIRSPNIWDTPDVYELENLASDRAGVIESAMAGLHRIDGARLLDIGCGAGFHLPGFARRGAQVTGIEPHRPLVAAARKRLATQGLSDQVEVLEAGAQDLPVADASVDIAHSRWAYFFGAGCEAGLAELDRVMRPGGVAMLIDNDATRSTFGAWFRGAYPAYDPVAVQRFWKRQGFSALPLTIQWTFDTRADLEAVVRIELPPEAADRLLAGHEGTQVDYGITLWHRTY